ncbi:MAG: peptide-methionine (S)-S-oxide reductase MsrA [Candidatus Diapherotrites archaeon]|uniref:Peptide methionine sulfoxide reductase MsrA n=1 Tax=Candidatus Iainarchaeum sp. TaxID=3101447 RepID=A0A8T3YKU9_9ARCH|nr:peptide-methionine (S)-S-oxide reductase MsrA [Candidatus Diapherotrites archaeon]
MVKIPGAKQSNSKRERQGSLEAAAFGAGCFWGVEEAFRQVPGVEETAVGYMGGVKEKPTYEDVCADETGHAEVVQVRFNPAEVSYEELLGIFWANHNPTTPNRQGPDVGSQYRSVIFFYTPEQGRLASESKEKAGSSGRWAGRAIVTEIVPAKPFWRAEEYHQKYLMKRGLESCHL